MVPRNDRLTEIDKNELKMNKSDLNTNVLALEGDMMITPQNQNPLCTVTCL
jgi:hypothetical protein